MPENLKNKLNKTSSIKKDDNVRSKSSKKNLIKQLNDICKDVDEEGLLFLVKQANVLVYNKRVQNYNAEEKKITIKKPPFSDKASMEIKEADDGSSFIFVINRARKFFTLEEMRKIVNICHISLDKNDASRRLYAWFRNNRGDVLNDIGIDNSNDPSLQTMYEFIIKRYKVKGK